MFCQYCGKQINDDAVYCQYCGRMQQRGSQWQGGYSAPTANQDAASVGFNVLSFFFPIVGLILFCVWHGNYPKRSHGIGIWALVGVGVRIVICVIVFALVLMLGLGVSTGGSYSTPSNSF